MKNILKAVIIFLGLFLLGAKETYALETDDTETYNILVIEINPTVSHPSGGNFGNGQKTIKASEYLGFHLNESVDFLKNNLEEVSHGTVKFNIVNTISLNEFPTYNTTASMTQSKFFEFFPVQSNGYGNWYNGVLRNPEYNTFVKNFGELNYTYLINKCDLINRKNRGEFDMVWLYGIDPLSPYETCMVGRNPFFVNGSPITADCDNFVIASMVFSRKDGMIEDIGHLSEFTLDRVYGAGYNQTKLDGTNLSKLNTWQKFILCKETATAATNVYGLGMVHFSPNSVPDPSIPNSTADYDWANNTPVNTYWKDFANGNLNNIGQTVSTYTYSSVYEGNTGTNYNASSTDYAYSNAACIAHHRWWFSSMPHYAGRDENGFSNNWWKYIMTPDYVTSLSATSEFSNKSITMLVGDEIDLKFIANRYSGKNLTLDAVTSQANVTVATDGAFSYVGGQVKATREGNGKIVIKYDGRVLELTINVAKYKITTPANISMTQGDAPKTVTLSITPALSGGDKISWTSSDALTAKVVAGTDTTKATITAGGVGSATITASVGSNMVTFRVTVNKKTYPAISNITYDIPSSLVVGETKKATVTIDSDPTAKDHKIEFISGNTSVLTVDSNGNICGKQAGTAMLTVRLDDGARARTVYITVEAHEYGKPTFSWQSNNTCYAECVCNCSLKHSTRNSCTVTASIFNYATFSSYGKTKYTAKYGEYTHTRVVDDIPAISSASISYTSTTYSGSATKPTVTAKDVKGNVIPSKYYTVSYSDASSTNVGTYSLYVSFKDKYSGYKNFTYTIKPKATGISSIANVSNGLKISWTKNAQGKGYILYRSTDGKSFSKLTTITSNTTLSYIDTSAANGKVYYYYLQVYNGTLNSAKSLTKSYARLVTPGISSIANTSKGLKLTWKKNAGASGYIIYRSLDGKTYTRIAKLTSPSTLSYVDTSTTNGKIYRYYVLSYKGSSSYSAKSAVTSYYRLTTPAITSLANKTGGKLAVAYSKNAKASGYQIKYVTGKTSKIVTISGCTKLSRVFTTLTKGKTYTFYVRAYYKTSSKTYYSAFSSGKILKKS